MAIVRNIQNGDLYRFHGGLTFENLRTGVKGEMPEDKAREFLKINVEATALINEHPMIAELIKTLNLKMEKDGVASV